MYKVSPAMYWCVDWLIDFVGFYCKICIQVGGLRLGSKYREQAKKLGLCKMRFVRRATGFCYHMLEM